MIRRRCALLLFVATATSACSAQLPSSNAGSTGTSSKASTRFCIATVTEWEVHRCVYELSPEKQKRRGFAQRLLYENGRFVGYDEINGLGVLADDSGRTSSHRYEYDGDRVASFTHLSRNGVIRGRAVVESDLVWVRWLDERGRPDPMSDSRASGLKRTLDARGRVVSYRYVDAVGIPTRSSDGRYEVRTSRNEAGALLQLEYFDEHGKKMRDRYGVHRETKTLDAMGLDTSVEFFDEEGGRVANDDGVHRTTYVYDDVGNRLQWAYFGVAGDRVRSREEGAASVRVERDAHGLEISRTHFDENGRPTTSAHGYVTRKRKLDTQGNPIEWSFFDEAGRPMRIGPKEHAMRRVALDPRGNEVREWYFDVDGRPMLYEDRYHEIESVYDERDNPVLGTYKDVSGHPYARDYYSSWKYEYDGDRRIATTFLNASLRPVEVGWGYATSRTEYEALGRKGETTYFDLLGRKSPTPNDCRTYAGDSETLAASLEPLLECARPGGSPGVALKVAISGRSLTNAAFLGLDDAPLRTCLETALASAEFADAGGDCVRASVGIRFSPPEIRVFSPVPKEDSTE